MDSGMIGKIEKAIRYAQERDRFQFQQFTVQVRGTNNTHTVSFDGGKLTCTCEFYGTRGACSHTIAMEKVLGEMLPGAIPLVMSKH
jgi:SWIM zinc finger